MLYSFPILLGFTFITTLLLLLLYSTKYRWLALLLSSLAFYFFVAEKFIWILFAFSFVIFFGGFLIEKQKENQKIKYVFIILLALLPLLFYKLVDPVIELINLIKLKDFHVGSANFYYVVGLSFFTFNGISYLIDIKRGYLKPERNYGLLLLFLCYFPHILAGPLHRAKFLIPQFKNNISLSNQNFSLGFRLILWGIFKKYAIAQHLKITADNIIDFPETHQGINMLFGGFIFFLHIYCDFTSYIDIGQGLSQFFGVKLKSNFNDRVYAASSRKEFWNGWHISLNHWFRDYFFFSITKNAKKQWQINLAILSTFFLIGLWHGATVSFIIWGILNGSWIILERYIKPHFEFINTKIRNPLGTIYHVAIASFIALVFRSNSLPDTLSAIANFNTKIDFQFPKKLIFLFLFMDIIYRLAKNKKIEDFIGEQKNYIRWLFYLITSTCILLWGINPDEFYYFKF